MFVGGGVSMGSSPWVAPFWHMEVGGYAVVGGVSELGRSSVVGGAVLFITPLVVEFDEGEVEGFEEDFDHAAYFEKECYHTFIRFSCFYLN
jgi:hypothetical protein